MYITEVVCYILRLLKAEVFPAGPMIAHHWMIGGDFTEDEGWAIPNFVEGRCPYSQPGRDFMDGVERVLRSVGERQHRVPPVTEVPMQLSPIPGQCEMNLQAVRDAFPRLLDDRARAFPKGLVPFWEEGIMHSYYLWSECIPTFFDNELVKSPGSSDWYVVFVSMFFEYFIVFQHETDPMNGEPVVTSWKLDGKISTMPDGERVYEVSAKLRVNHGVDEHSGRTYMEFLKERWTPANSLVCGSPMTTLIYPMVLDLVAERCTGMAPRRNQLIRCMTVPDNIQEAVLVTGRRRRDPITGIWEPISKEF